MSTIRWAFIENIATLFAIAAIIVGVYAFGGGGNGFWALVLVANLNSYSSGTKAR